MTRDEAKSFWSIIKAFSEGKEVQRVDDDGYWRSSEDFNFSRNPATYRIKPSHTIRPYNREECEALVGKVIRAKLNRSVYVVAQCLADELPSVRLLNGRVLASELLGCFEHLDGSPCGVKEGE